MPDAAAPRAPVQIRRRYEEKVPLTLERSKTVDEESSTKVVEFLDRNDPKKTGKPFFVCHPSTKPCWVSGAARTGASRCLQGPRASRCSAAGPLALYNDIFYAKLDIDDIDVDRPALHCYVTIESGQPAVGREGHRPW